MDSGPRVHSLCMLSTAVAMHTAACVCLWRFLTPGERRCFIAACRELDFFCLQAVRHAGTTTMVSLASSGDSDLNEEAKTRREGQNAARWSLDDLEDVVPEVSAAVAFAQTAGRLIRDEAHGESTDAQPDFGHLLHWQPPSSRRRLGIALGQASAASALAPPPLTGSARVFRSGLEECDVSWRGDETLSMLLNSAAATCRDHHGFLGWHVDSITVHLRALDYRPSFDTTLEETAHLRMLRARRLLRPGCFAYRVARRRRAGS